MLQRWTWPSWHLVMAPSFVSDTSYAEYFLGSPGGLATLSGLQEPDYPSMEGSGLNQRSMMRKVPLPAELVEHFGHMQCNCLIGLFPEIERAWLTIDSDIYDTTTV